MYFHMWASRSLTWSTRPPREASTESAMPTRPRGTRSRASLWTSSAYRSSSALSSSALPALVSTDLTPLAACHQDRTTLRRARPRRLAPTSARMRRSRAPDRTQPPDRPFKRQALRDRGEGPPRWSVRLGMTSCASRLHTGWIPPRLRACLVVHEDNQIISAAMTTIAR